VAKWSWGEILPTYLHCCQKAVQTVEKGIMGKSIVPGFGQKVRIVLQMTYFTVVLSEPLTHSIDTGCHNDTRIFADCLSR